MPRARHAAYVPDPPAGSLAFDEAVELALQRIRESRCTTRWSVAAVPGAPSDPLPTDPDWAGGSLYVDERERAVGRLAASAVAGHRGHRRRAAAGTPSRRLGGPRVAGQAASAASGCAAAGATRTTCGSATRGLLAGRGGGPGQAAAPAGGDASCPGLAWLECASRPTTGGGGRPATASGRSSTRGACRPAYWWALWPFHGLVFGGMQRNIAPAAEQLEERRAASRRRPP